MNANVIYKKFKALFFFGHAHYKLLQDLKQDVEDVVQLKADVHALRTTWIGRVIYHLIPYKRSIAKQNIEKVFHQSLSAADKKQFAMAYYSHIVSCLKEIVLIAIVPKKYLQHRVEVKGIEHLWRALEKGRGAIVLTGHLGSWEFSPLFFLDKIQKRDHQFYVVRKALRFDFLTTVFWRRFEEAGFKIINKNNALFQAKTALKNKHVVFVPFDLKPKEVNKGSVWVDFLRQPTLTYASVVYLAEKLDASILSIAFYRLNKKQHVLEFYPEIPWVPHQNRQEAFLKNTQNYSHRLEEMLLLHPEQWLWSYKRW